MSAKEKKGLAIVLGLIALVVITIYGIKIISIGFDVSECDKMTPYAVSEFTSPDTVTLDFSKKKAISIGKYGYRKKIIVEEPCIITQSVSGPKTGNAYFGIFKDKKLEDPVEIVDFTWIYKDGPYEEGEVDEKPYDKERDGIVALQPGTYYAGIYSTSPFADFEALYTSAYCPLNEHAVMKEGQDVNFYCLEADQINTLKIKPSKDGKILISTNIFFNGALDIFNNKGRQIAHHVADPESDQPMTVYLNVNKGKNYDVKISGLYPGKEVFSMYLYSVKYRYIH